MFNLKLTEALPTFFIITVTSQIINSLHKAGIKGRNSREKRFYLRTKLVKKKRFEFALA